MSDTPPTQAPRTASLNRRHWLLAAGALALTTGAGVVAWRSLRTEPGIDAALDTLWAWQLPDAAGQMQALSSYRGRPLLVNFWATWCPPCVHELPLLSQFAQAHPEVQLLGIAADKPASVAQWLQRKPLAYPNVVAQTGAIDLTRALGNLNGGLPFSLLLDAKGQIRQRRIGAFTEDILQRWIASI